MRHVCNPEVREVVTRSLWAPTGPSLAPRPPDVLSHRLVGSRLGGVVGRAEPPSLGVGGVQKGDLGAEVHGAFSHHFQPKQAPRMVAEAAGDRVKEPRALQSRRSGDLEGVGTKQAL